MERVSSITIKKEMYNWYDITLTVNVYGPTPTEALAKVLEKLEIEE